MLCTVAATVASAADGAVRVGDTGANAGRRPHRTVRPRFNGSPHRFCESVNVMSRRPRLGLGDDRAGSAPVVHNSTLRRDHHGECAGLTSRPAHSIAKRHLLVGCAPRIAAGTRECREHQRHGKPATRHGWSLGTTPRPRCHTSARMPIGAERARGLDDSCRPSVSNRPREKRNPEDGEIAGAPIVRTCRARRPPSYRERGDHAGHGIDPPKLVSGPGRTRTTG